MIDQFVLDNVFNKIESDDSVDVMYWRECIDPGEGYILYWPSTDSHHHTYTYPPNIVA